MRKYLTAAATLACLVGLWAVPTALPAAASDNDVTLTLDVGDTDGVSAEYANLAIPVNAGDVLSVDWTLSDGAECTGGAPRAFVIVNAQVVNTWDDDPGNCDGTAEVALPNAGVVTHAGLVYDNSVPGTVTFTNLQVGGTPIPEPVDPTPTTVPEPGDVLDCDDIDPNTPVEPGDPNNLDGDNDGIACEQTVAAPVAQPATPVAATPRFTG